MKPQTIVTVDSIHKILLKFEQDGYFIEDVLETRSLGTQIFEEEEEENDESQEIQIDEELQSYLQGKEKLHDFWFEIELELFQIMEGIPLEKFIDILMVFMSIILEMREEKLRFQQLKYKRGKNWKTRREPQPKTNKRNPEKLETPEKIADTSDNIKDYEYCGQLPIGYETQWYGNIKKELLYFIDDIRFGYNLPKKQKIIQDAIAKIYSKL